MSRKVLAEDERLLPLPMGRERGHGLGPSWSRGWAAEGGGAKREDFAVTRDASDGRGFLDRRIRSSSDLLGKRPANWVPGEIIANLLRIGLVSRSWKSSILHATSSSNKFTTTILPRDEKERRMRQGLSDQGRMRMMMMMSSDRRDGDKCGSQTESAPFGATLSGWKARNGQARARSATGATKYRNPGPKPGLWEIGL